MNNSIYTVVITNNEESFLNRTFMECSYAITIIKICATDGQEMFASSISPKIELTSAWYR